LGDADVAREAVEGWAHSADAYIAFQDEAGVGRGDAARRLLLDPAMLAQCGDVAGLEVMDLGCGEGRFCRMLGERGARTVGIDVTRRMVEVAVERDAGAGAYVWGSAERLPFADASFDLVVSYITLVDIPDYRAAIAEAARVLRPGGRLVVANLSFVTAASPWVKDEQGRRLHRALDRYVEEWARVYEWSGIRITNFHRPLSHYMQAYLGAGLELRAFVEPVPADDSLRADPYFEDWYRVPEFTVMAWEKRGAARGSSPR
jgi:SAM-dependent methyltransferase